MDMNLRSAMVMKDVNRRNTIPENATNLPQLPKKTMKAHIPGHSSIIFNDFFGHFGVNWRNLGASPQWYPGGTTDFASAENRGIARICCKVLDLDGGGESPRKFASHSRRRSVYLHGRKCLKNIMKEINCIMNHIPFITSSWPFYHIDIIVSLPELISDIYIAENVDQNNSEHVLHQSCHINLPSSRMTLYIYISIPFNYIIKRVPNRSGKFRR